MSAVVSKFPYGTGWTAPAKPDWRSEPLSGGKFPWFSSSNLTASLNKYRKGDCQIAVVTPANAGKPGVSVSVALKQHAFIFGSVWDSGMIADAPELLSLSLPVQSQGRLGETTLTATDRSIYRTKLVDGTFNGMKPESAGLQNLWETGFDIRARPEELRANCIPTTRWVRWQSGVKWREMAGMNCIYPASDRMTGGSDKATKRAHWRSSYFPDITNTFANEMTEWALVNEIDSGSIYDVTSGYKSLDPDCLNDLLYIQSQIKRDWYINDWQSVFNTVLTADNLTNNGIQVKKLGFQGHMNSGTSDMAATRDGWCGQFHSGNFRANGSTVAPWDQTITEFDVKDTDAALQANTLEAVLRAAFGNPSFTSFYVFGWYQPCQWLYETYGSQFRYGFYDRDWNPTANKTVWDALTKSEWMTNASGTTDSSGVFQFNGFFGEYEVTINDGGNITVHRFELAPSMPQIVFVNP